MQKGHRLGCWEAVFTRKLKRGGPRVQSRVSGGSPHLEDDHTESRSGFLGRRSTYSDRKATDRGLLAFGGQEVRTGPER